MTYNSSPKTMRTWIADLEEAGELIRIDKPVDPLTQMGSLRRPQPPQCNGVAGGIRCRRADDAADIRRGKELTDGGIVV